MFGLGTTEILMIILVVAVLFGARRLPELGKGLGHGLRGFRDALKGKDDTETTTAEQSESESAPPLLRKQ